MKTQSVEDSMVESCHIVLPSHANAVGSIFGGTVMSWIDVVAAICAQRHSQKICVTASVDALNFLHPIKVGDTVVLKARMVYTGRTSMMVYVIVSASDLKGGKCDNCVDAYLTFVAIGEDGKPEAIPSLKLETKSQKEEFAAAAERRKRLLAEKKT